MSPVQTTRFDREALLDWDAEVKAVIVAEEADGRAGIYISIPPPAVNAIIQRRGDRFVLATIGGY